LQTLGFRDANSQAQSVRVDAFPADNSYYDPATDRISLGRGGVDDAEDPEVVWHEYGHALQDDQVLDWGRSRDSRAIGEGFGDYMAVTMSQGTAHGTSKTPAACVMDWDATSYTLSRPHCLRRTDTNARYPADVSGEPHAEGQIWSRALWDMNRALGRSKATRIIVEAQFWMNPKVTMPQAANATVFAAQQLYGAAVATTTRRAFSRRGIL
jgi:Zn-dependent metalloprotease